MILGLSAMFLLISPAQSLTCKSQTFTNSKSYSNCMDLPTLGAYLHWTYDSAKSSLSIAFLAPPAKSNGWISWGINPTSTGMLGAQALIALKGSNGSMTADTYNISSYKFVQKSKIAFNVSGLKAENSGDLMRIYATLELPGGTDSVNQVWQVGESVTGGLPDKHEVQTANLNAKGTLALVSGAKAGSPFTAPTMTPTPTAGGEPVGPPKGGVSRIEISNFSSYFLLLIASLVLWF
ncbi:hypothetical protein NMG60_11001216 [Bertholletia excelsa]